MYVMLHLGGNILGGPLLGINIGDINHKVLNRVYIQQNHHMLPSGHKIGIHFPY